jgi:hypothetical protein
MDISASLDRAQSASRVQVAPAGTAALRYGGA